MSQIEIKDLLKHYATPGGLIEAADGISFNVEKGDFFLITGEEASGKSTLLSMLGGLNRPTSGNILVNGTDIYDLSAEKLADFRHSHLGFVFQSFQLLPFLTVLENVMLPFVTNEYSLDQQKEMALSVLRKVYLYYKSGMLPGVLTRGEQQRVAIARAMVKNPEIILIDEANPALDTSTSTGIMELLKELNEDGRTIITVSRSRELESYANKSLYLSQGKGTMVKDEPVRNVPGSDSAQRRSASNL
ncbi:MAG TPA: ABC transporter ATP-binding protein [Ignavibacteriales bacterium]|nr:ABC transporter ATP-binding protein [Ignavibacteriales bacterium]